MSGGGGKKNSKLELRSLLLAIGPTAVLDPVAALAVQQEALGVPDPCLRPDPK